MKIDYCAAIIGFDRRKGRNVVVKDGIIIFKKHKKELLKYYKEMMIEIKEKE